MSCLFGRLAAKESTLRRVLHHQQDCRYLKGKSIVLHHLNRDKKRYIPEPIILCWILMIGQSL